MRAHRSWTAWRSLLAVLVGFHALGAWALAAPPSDAPAPAAKAPLGSGIDLQYVDDTVRVQDDIYRHLNGKWLASMQIPADKGAYDAFDALEDRSKDQLRGIIEKLQGGVDPADPDQRKIADLYASFVDEAAVERAGLEPLHDELARIDALQSKAAVAGLIAHFNRIGVQAPLLPQVHQDAHDSTRYVFDIGQDGLGMPDRDYYLLGDETLKKIRTRYLQHVERMLALAGDSDAAGSARDVLAVETALARVQWTKVQNRDPVKTYNKVELARLPALARGFDWTSYLAESGVAGRTDYLVVSQPSYVTGLDKVLRATPLAAWKTYFRWHLLSDDAPYLGKAFVDEHFAFYGAALRGVEQDEPRWKRGVRLVDASIGEALGRLYVARYFPPASKARMDQLVRNLLAAYKADIDTLDWMGPDTRRKAQEKLARFTTKIGYPEHWRDYGALRIAPGDLMGNVVRARAFEYDRNLAKLGKPIDRDEWDMTPPTVNAYYNPEKNEIVFPAGILQPPFFNPEADDAANYGGIGGVIGHEISHGFDDQGSQYDGAGNLLKPPGWFTQADLARFKSRTRALVKQYSAYAPVPGFPINGELTLGENIADNSGLAIAYKAYRLSLGTQQAPVIDGLTGDQRLFLGWVQIWRGKVRDNQAIMWIKSDPHSPDRFRGLLPEMNVGAFYEAFDVKPGDKMYLPPKQRVSLW
jgi:predicted metalloendopeptidase